MLFVRCHAYVVGSLLAGEGEEGEGILCLQCVATSQQCRLLAGDEGRKSSAGPARKKMKPGEIRVQKGEGRCAAYS